MPPRPQTIRLPPSVSCQCIHSRSASTFASDLDLRRMVDDFRRTTSTKGRRRHSPLSKANARSGQKRNLLAWLTGPGENFRDPFPGSTNYLNAYDETGELKRLKIPNQNVTKSSPDALTAKDGRMLPVEKPADMMPFPMNQAFRSQSVLSEELRERIYQMVAEEEQNIEDVAAAYQVDVRRVAAVVRLKTVEKQWVRSNKKLATPYAKAVMAMLPQTRLNATEIEPHESINDLPVHPKTRQQLFYPAAESRQFNREDAAKAFSDQLLPADKRIPLPKLVKTEKMKIDGVPRQERLQILREDNEREAAEVAEKEEKRKAWEKRTQTFVPTNRWVFRFQDIGAQRISPQGRSQTAVGARYGWPHEDRKRGMVKIPTSVE